MKYIIPAFLVFIFLVSCENKSASNEQQVVPYVLNPDVPAVNDSTGKSNTAVGPLNPKHGEPGHRCDIAEGAPLSTPAASTSIQPTVSPTITPVTIPSKVETPAPNTATAGLNPKHGEPGHRCDIAVGAPLNSKPTQ